MSNIECKSVITKVTDKLRMRRNPHVCYTCKVFFGLWKGSCFPCQLGNETCVTESLALFQDFAVCGVLDMLDQFSINITNKLPNHPFSLLAQFCLLGWSQSSNQSGGDPINSSDYRGISLHVVVTYYSHSLCYYNTFWQSYDHHDKNLHSLAMFSLEFTRWLCTVFRMYF